MTIYQKIITFTNRYCTVLCRGLSFHFETALPYG